MANVPPGVPCWADLATADLAAAKRFYTELFGWTGRVTPQPEAGGYTTFLLDGLAAAGVGPPATPEQVPIWSTYVATDDPELVATRVEAAGGQVVVPPLQIFDQGRMAVFADPAGATFSVWQPMEMRGAEVFNAPGAMSWTELVTPDPEGAKTFYELVFGWQPEDHSTDPVTYTGWRCGDQVVAGMMPPIGDGFSAGLPAYWSVYFAVADADAAAVRATELGGDVLVPPMDAPAGRTAALRDPQGALFWIVTLRPEGRAPY
ncbi:VOC family protein [Micromonospora sp. SH-82]|uniref:VOC family protein n=1 Tax=Micromonospora sp. SH-82 TaxID=3132938 RepID=UPI003EBD4D6C